MLKIEKSVSLHKAAIRGLMIAVFAVFLLGTAGAQTLPLTPGGEAAALGGAVTALSGNVWAAFSNPGLLTGVGNGGAVHLSPSPFGVRELSGVSAVFNHGFLSGSLGVGLQAGGFELFREYGVTAAYAHGIGDGISAGASVAYRRLNADGYGGTGFLSVNAGLAAQPSQGLVLAASVWNVNQPRIGTTLRERLPLVIAVGTAYTVHPAARLCLDIQKQDVRPFNTRAGVDVRLNELLAVRAGANTDPGAFTGGIGLTHAGISFDYAVMAHPDLGLVHGLSLAILLDRAARPLTDTNAFTSIDRTSHGEHHEHTHMRH